MRTALRNIPGSRIDPAEASQGPAGPGLQLWCSCTLSPGQGPESKAGCLPFLGTLHCHVMFRTGHRKHALKGIHEWNSEALALRLSPRGQSGPTASVSDLYWAPSLGYTLCGSLGHSCYQARSTCCQRGALLTEGNQVPEEVTFELVLKDEKEPAICSPREDVWELGRPPRHAAQMPPVVVSALPQVVATFGQPCMGIFFF